MLALDAAIKELGSLTELAKSIQVSPQVIANWRARETVPLNQCLAIELATKGAVTCEQLRDDVDWIRVNGRITHYQVRVSREAA